jgi:hypothetical protein
MDGLQYGEGSTEFILKGVDGFGSYNNRDLCYGVFLGDEYFVLFNMYYVQSHSQQRRHGGLGILIPSFLVLSFCSFQKQ